MTTKPFDQFNKRLFETLLSPFGTVTPNRAVLGEERAIAELLLLPEDDVLRMNVLSLLVSWRINMDLLEQANDEERRILMALSQAYLEWEQQTRRQGMEEGLEGGRQEGRQEGRRAMIVSLLESRFGSIDAELQLIIPALIALSPEEFVPLIMQRSRDGLLEQFLN